tara:strand:- start:3180 stop:3767 length:588 start_codon:yes stop_codon:yes gene_type:complete
MSELAKALAEFQAAQTGLELDKQGNRSQYASVGSVMTKVKQAAQHGLSFSQLVDYEDGVGTHLKTYIMHTSGEEKVGRYPIAVDDMTNNQKLGSAISYARRYALMAALGMAAGIQEVEFDDDDDGEINGALTATPYDLDDLEIKIQKFTSLVGLNAWIGEINPMLTEMSKANPKDWERFYAFWKKQEKDISNGKT